jgi:hypothetical protein
MTTKDRVATILIALAIFGCKGPMQTSAASSGEGVNGAASADGASTGASGGAHKEYITDPSMDDMNAIGVTIPAKWHFQGILMQGGTCASAPFAVYRATSPDGLSYQEQMPTLAWEWGTGPLIGYMKKDDCLPMRGPLSAQNYLKYLAATMKVNYDADEAVPAELNAKAQKMLADAQARYAPQYAASHLQPPKQVRELARAEVSYMNGSFRMKGRLGVLVDCTETTYAGSQTLSAYSPGHPPQLVNGRSSTVDKCMASTIYVTAPASQFAGVVRQWDEPGMGSKPEDAWLQAWINRDNAESQQRIQGIIRSGEMQREQTAQMWAHNNAVRQQMHDQFMQTMQQNHDDFMARQQASQDARTTQASDWVDFALDRQTVVDPNTGQVSKASSSYSHTWVDETGKTSYQTNDVNANPNGVLPGTWTQQTVTHGNGTPY